MRQELNFTLVIPQIFFLCRCLKVAAETAAAAREAESKARAMVEQAESAAAGAARAREDADQEEAARHQWQVTLQAAKAAKHLSRATQALSREASVAKSEVWKGLDVSKEPKLSIMY